MKGRTLLVAALVVVLVGAVGTQLMWQPQTVNNNNMMSRELVDLPNVEVMPDRNPNEEESIEKPDTLVPQQSEVPKDSSKDNPNEKDSIEKPDTLVPQKEDVPEVQNVVPDVTPEVVPEVTTPTPEVQKPDTSTEQTQFLAAVEQRIFELVNVERQKAGMSALSYNKTMEKYARIKSKDMADQGYFDHRDLRGELITTMIEADGVAYQAWGENIAYIGGGDVNTLADQFMTNWMNSEGHRANILSDNFDSIGVGVYQAAGEVYATQEFHR